MSFKLSGTNKTFLESLDPKTCALNKAQSKKFLTEKVKEITKYTGNIDKLNKSQLCDVLSETLVIYNEVQSTITNLGDIQKEMNLHKKQITKMKGIESLKQRIKQKVSLLNNKNKIVIKNLSQINRDIKDLDSSGVESIQTNTKLVSKNKEIKVLNKQIIALENKISTVSNEKANVLANSSQLEHKLSQKSKQSKQSKSIDSLEELVKNISQNLAQAVSQIKTLTKNEKILHDELLKAIQREEQLQTDIKQLKNSQSDNTKIHNILKIAKAEKQKLVSEIDSNKSDISSLTSQLKDLDQVLRERNKQINELKGQVRTELSRNIQLEKLLKTKEKSAVIDICIDELKILQGFLKNNVNLLAELDTKLKKLILTNPASIVNPVVRKKIQQNNDLYKNFSSYINQVISQTKLSENYSSPVNCPEVRKAQSLINSGNLNDISTMVRDDFEDLKGIGRIYLRLRPRLDSIGDPVVSIKDSVITLPCDNSSKTYQGYDNIVHAHQPTNEFYQKELETLVKNIHRGYNLTFMTYGQSGAGKSYTITNLMSETLGTLNKMKIDNIQMGAFQLYKGRPYDLLAGPVQKPIMGRQFDKKFELGDSIRSISDIVYHNIDIQDTSAFASRLEDIEKRKVFREVIPNKHSSRSHIFTTIKFVFNDKPVKITFIDLAGNERTRDLQVNSEAFREGDYIVKSNTDIKDLVKRFAKGQPLPVAGVLSGRLIIEALKFSLGNSNSEALSKMILILNIHGFFKNNKNTDEIICASTKETLNFGQQLLN